MRPVVTEREHGPHNPTRHTEVQDNIATVQLQIDEFAGRLFNEPLTPVRRNSVRAAQFLFTLAVALQGSIVGIQINNEKVARAIGVKPINRDAHQIDGSHRLTPHAATIFARKQRAQQQQNY
jgi:hypothetical protein